MKLPCCFGVIVVLILGCQTGLRGADPELIRGAASLPKTSPWNLQELSRPPAFKWAEGEKVRSLYYQSVPFKGKSTRVFAYYATPGTISGDPSKDKNLPAVVLVHGGGGKAFSVWAELWAKRGYAAIAMDLSGFGPMRKRLADGGPDQNDPTKFINGIDQPLTDQWTYHSVANVILAHSLIRTFKEVDSERTGITGISWGGYLTCIVSGLDNRFKAAAPIYGCGFLRQNSIWLDWFEKMSPEQGAKWDRYWDPSHYAGLATMPMLYVNGGTDGAYFPDSHAKTFALVKSPKTLHFVPHFPHGHIFDRPRCVEVFMAHHLKGGQPLAQVGMATKKDGQVVVIVKSSTNLVGAKLHYTFDPPTSSQPKKRKWVSQEATIDQGHISSKAPPKNVKIWFFTVTDERKTIVASPLVFPNP
jgi:cephalosporin-C deacetylase-like acetyl esterase